MDNWRLYPAALQELGRVCKPHTGRAVLLTHDTRVMAHVSSWLCVCLSLSTILIVGVEY